eukprot:350951-Chlamydomonas_euryale.AAC.7
MPHASLHAERLADGSSSRISSSGTQRARLHTYVQLTGVPLMMLRGAGRDAQSLPRAAAQGGRLRSWQGGRGTSRWPRVARV